VSLGVWPERDTMALDQGLHLPEIVFKRIQVDDQAWGIHHPDGIPYASNRRH
jgi:hypothetical protein